MRTVPPGRILAAPSVPAPRASRHPESLLSDILAKLRDALGDRYQVDREIGAGGAATVYLATDLRHDRQVAIKVFRPELAESLGVERFTREIHLAAALQHPHILTVHDSGAANGLLYYVMPYVEGESLRARIEREGGLPVPDVIRILREVADALSFAHQHGVVHRDIKPDNVLLMGRHVLVADFGVAKAISVATEGQALTMTGIALGTPAYMSPEQAAADPHVDHRADLYALGALGYELLTGEPPFVRRTAQQVIAAHMTEAAPSVASRRPAVPPALDALIARCLAKQPADRPQSADEVVAELERLATPGATVTAATPAAPSVRAGARRFVLAGAVVVAIAAAWFALARMRSGGGALDANVVAVLPFEFSATPDIEYLREGIVNVLEANLTGEGGPRAVASQTSIAEWKRRGGDKKVLGEDEARAAARALGAGSLIRGSIVGTASNVIVSATLAPLTPGAKSVVARQSGPSDSIASIASRLATQLMTLRAGEGAERTASLQAVPPAALRAYLEGQHAYRDARYGDAVAAFSKALAVDSTFALAAMSHAMASGFNVTTYGTSPGYAIAYRHRDKLAARDLTLLEMAVPGQFRGRAMSGQEVMEVRERLVGSIPDRPEAWYLIGDSYLHYGTAYGYTREESAVRAESAIRKALALDPGIEYLRGHLADARLFAGDEAGYVRVVDSLDLQVPYHRFTRAIVAGDSAEVRRMAPQFDAMDSNLLMYVGLYASAAGAVRIADTVFRKVLARPADVAERAGLLGAMHQMYMLTGQLSAARTASERLRALDERGGPPDPDLDIYEAILAEGDSAAAARAVAFLERTTDLSRAPTASNRVSAWLIGVWAAHRGDSTKAATSIRYLDALAAQRDTTDGGGRSRLYAEVLRIINRSSAPPREVVERADSMLHDGPPVGQARAPMNIVVARSWERLGDARRAARAIARIPTMDPNTFPLLGPAMRDQGRMALAVGDTAWATSTWRQYLRWRTNADPAQQEADGAIRARLLQLESAKR